MLYLWLPYLEHSSYKFVKEPSTNGLGECVGGRTVGGGVRSRDYQIFCHEKIYFPMARS